MPEQYIQTGSYLILAARFNALVTERLAAGARHTLLHAGIDAGQIEAVDVSGAWELPPVALVAAGSGRYAGIVACAAVIRGETPHFEHVARAAVDGLARVQLDTRVPVGFAVLTVDTLEQALNRAGGKGGNKGEHAAQAMLETVAVLSRFGDRGNAVRV